MDFKLAIDILNTALKERRPTQFSSSWIYLNIPEVYRFIWKHVRTELGDIDWDRVVCKLDRQYQKRWMQRRTKIVKAYRNIQEVRKVLKPFKEKLYIFIEPIDKKDRILCDVISIALVRVAQKGNIKAQEELVSFLRFTVDQWIELSPRLRKWQGYSDKIDDKIINCIRCYRYTGTFLGYLFRTLEYTGRGLLPVQIYSLDETNSFEGEQRRIENVIQDGETGEIRIYNRIY